MSGILNVRFLDKELKKEIIHNNQNNNMEVKSMSNDYSKMTPVEFATEIDNIIKNNDEITASEKLDEIDNIISNSKYLNNPAELAKFVKDKLDNESSNKLNVMSFEQAQNLVRKWNHIQTKKISVENQDNIDNDLDDKKMTEEEAKNLVKQFSR